MHAQAPHVVWEIGTADGGTLWAIAQALRGTLAGRRAHFVSVDLPNGKDDALLELVPGLEIIRGDSRTVELPDERPDFVLIDGDHSYDGVRADWLRCWPRVRPGGICALHDVLMHADPVNQPMAVDEFWLELEVEPDLVTLVIRDSSPASAAWSQGDWGGVAWGGFGVVFKQ